MSWEFTFGFVNALALLMWAALILLRRTELLLTVVLYAGVALLCLAYVIMVLLLLSGAGGGAGGADFTSIAGVRAIFATDGGVVAGWTHYLAFDLFVGLWIARDADNKAFSRLWQAPVLLLILVAGPAGLLLWLILREPAARRANPRKGMKI